MNNSRGVARHIDDLGRIVIPVELRRMFAIEAGDELEIATDGMVITLTKVERRCVFCGSDTGLRPFRAKQVCGPCVVEVGGNPDGERHPTAEAGSTLSL